MHVYVVSNNNTIITLNEIKSTNLGRNTFELGIVYFTEVCFTIRAEQAKYMSGKFALYRVRNLFKIMVIYYDWRLIKTLAVLDWPS